jgi:DNA-binding NtrC family response regulator
MGKVLVVDDDPSVVFVLEEILRADGHAVVSTLDPRDALGLLPGVEVALVDRYMPGEGGASLIERIRSENPCLPVILLTADAPARGRALAEAVGAFGVMEKPVDIDELTRLVDQAIAASRRLSSETGRSRV